ncbi:MAG: sugar phosphate isomerase/epimerase family protein [Rubripirellula sp.]
MKHQVTEGLNRRSFLTACLGGVSGAIATKAKAQDPSFDNELCVFTKPFNSLSFTDLAKQIAKLGFDGIEAPIRRGGHVEPENVQEKLPELHEALREHGLNITVMTTDINDPDDPLTEKTLRTAAMLGIKRYRMKYFRYDPSQSIQKQLLNFRSRSMALAEMNHQFGIQGLYQNHAGKDYCGAAIWDLETLLDGIDPSDIGVAYDIRHASVEGGTSWPTTWRMIEPKVQTVYVKDFQWEEGPRPVNVPLGQGRISENFFKLLKESNFTGPISLHEEYLDHRDPSLVENHLKAIENDLAVLQSWLD